MKKWHPEQGERVYISHAITKHKYKSSYFVRWWGGCLIVFYENKLHRLHVRHSGMKQILKTKNGFIKTETMPCGHYDIGCSEYICNDG